MILHESELRQVVTTWFFTIDENHFKKYCQERNITEIENSVIHEYLDCYKILPHYSEEEEIEATDDRFDDSDILALQKFIDHD